MKRSLTRDDVVIKVFAYPEQDMPDGDPDFVAAVNEMYMSAEGDWGWCRVAVEASFGGMCGVAHLGQCSYLNLDDFKAGGYYEQLVEEAVGELNSVVELMVDALRAKGVID